MFIIPQVSSELVKMLASVRGAALCRLMARRALTTPSAPSGLSAPCKSSDECLIADLPITLAFSHCQPFLILGLRCVIRPVVEHHHMVDIGCSQYPSSLCLKPACAASYKPTTSNLKVYSSSVLPYKLCFRSHILLKFLLKSF